MLNGVSGCWIACKQGLRQGDMISPYLFIIVADVLQKLVHCAHRVGLHAHHLVADRPCLVLQYADDTLILTKGHVDSIRELRAILGSFSKATGLTINFRKSTFVPIHVPADTTAEMAEILGCDVSTFPQTYLGLPLSPHKLWPADFQPLVENFDRFLAGWKARLLSTGSRLVLVNTFLSSLAIYHMSSILLPKTMVDVL
jgi:hypothetical protein